MKPFLLQLAIIFGLISTSWTFQVILDRNFGMKMHCFIGLGNKFVDSGGLSISDSFTCSQVCYDDRFDSNKYMSFFYWDSSDSILLTFQKSDFVQPYSYLSFEYEHLPNAAPLGLRQLSFNELHQKYQYRHLQELLYEDSSSLYCNFSGEGGFEQSSLQLGVNAISDLASIDQGDYYQVTFASMTAPDMVSDYYIRALYIVSNCVQNCKICSESTSCGTCDDGFQRYQMDSGEFICEIVGSCQILNCSRCTIFNMEEICRSCLPGYTLNANQECVQNSSDLSSCAPDEYFENGQCMTYGQIGYMESYVDGSWQEIKTLTSTEIQSKYKCPHGLLAIVKRGDKFSQYSCRCFIDSCVSCSSILTCDRCLNGFTFNKSSGACEKASYSSNSFSISSSKTENGFEIRAKFQYPLLYTTLSSSDVSLTIADFSKYSSSFVGLENSTTLLMKIEMLGQAKNRNAQIKFTNSDFIATNTLSNEEATTRLPAFVYVSSSDKDAANSAQSAAQAATGAIVGTLLIIVIISKFSAIVATIDLTGFLYYLLYIEARFPVNVVSFYGVFKNFQMDFIPNPFTSIITPGYFQYSDVRFMQSDTDAYFLDSTGQSIIIFLIIVIMYLVAKILSKIDIPFISNYFKKSVNETWEFGGYFDAVWTIYIYLLIGVMLQFQSFDCSDSSCGWNYFIFSISFIVSFGVPILIVKLIRDNPFLKDNEYLMTKLSSLITGVRLYSEKEFKEELEEGSSKFAIFRDKYAKKLTKYYMPILYLRKIIFSLIILCLGASGYTQITLITLLNIGMAAYFLVLRPLDSNYENYKGAISEVVMVVYQILVGILIEDPETQEETDRINIGWAAIAIISLVILWHTMGIIFDFLVAIWAALKAMIAKRQQQLKVLPMRVGADAVEGELLQQSSEMLNINKQKSGNNLQQSYSQLELGNDSPVKTRTGTHFKNNGILNDIEGEKKIGHSGNQSFNNENQNIEFLKSVTSRN